MFYLSIDIYNCIIHGGPIGLGTFLKNQLIDIQDSRLNGNSFHD